MQNFSKLYSSGEREFDKWVDYKRKLRDSKIELGQMKGLLSAFETMTKDEIVELQLQKIKYLEGHIVELVEQVRESQKKVEEIKSD